MEEVKARITHVEITIRVTMRSQIILDHSRNRLRPKRPQMRLLVRSGSEYGRIGRIRLLELPKASPNGSLTINDAGSGKFSICMQADIVAREPMNILPAKSYCRRTVDCGLSTTPYRVMCAMAYHCSLGYPRYWLSDHDRLGVDVGNPN